MSTFAVSKSSLNRRRVMFVDDEPFALEVLQRVFEPMRNEWHMEFVTTGPEALERMGQLKFDAVVTDLNMPGMNGAELLEQIARKHPSASRIILSAQADEDLVFQSVNTAHQFISKTADPRNLVKKIRKLILLRQSNLSLELVEMICSLEKLPTIPEVYTQLVEALANPNSELSDMAAIISRDAAMSAKVLQLANSAFFGLRGEVASIQDAVTFLGIETVRYLVLMVGVCEQFRSSKFMPGFVERIWAHSTQTANLCRIIAQAEQLSLAMTEQAFVAGLLHDVGKLVFAENLTKGYREVLEYSKINGQPSWVVERMILKATHGEVGAYLLDLWGLPEGVTRAVALHHEPVEEESDTLTPLAIVHVANHIAREMSKNSEPGEGDLNLEYIEAMGLTDRIPIWREAIDQVQAAAV
jgi:putative nucleotidyltransferase with HDIG domain